ncbi:right-handed parallel beta-helix repeat-containing protein [Dactylosporangium aurantiacum]|uniref:Right-handed parallel beta-helix repeat-containing protein n=1 Tax=Dactylosporangium aurantiacum TaxID=35754 RepID=A0A9Q9IU62_9ACTN|nr:right-handed parallel beta-helix repeat-containing protein [Dactylosporangium aurantiacum]
MVARVRPLAFDGAGTDRFAGLAARSTGSTSYDRLVLLSGDRVELQAVRSGAVTVLGVVSLPVSTGRWYTLRLEESGTTVRGYVDGALVGSGPSQSATGRLGVQTFRASADFDDVVAQTGGGTGPSPGTPASGSPSAPASPSPSTSASVPPGSTLIVAPTGDDAAAGTLAAPLRTIQRAVDLARPGTTIALRGGTYAPATNVQLVKSGTAAAPYTITNYAGERVLLDAEQMPHTPAPLDASIPNAERGAIHIEASYWRIVGIEIAHGPYGIFCRDCSDNVFDRLVTRDNYETGLHIQGASSRNQVLNLDSYGNHDPRKNGESADGLAVKEGSGTGNVVRGARLWNNVDDGFDAWEFLSPITIESSVAWGNGVNRWNFPDFAGDGNGFKLGGGDEDLPAGHVVRDSIAFDNAQGGFIDNANPGALRLDHVTAWRNGGTGVDVADAAATVTASLAVANRVQVSLGSSASSGNSWDLGGTWTPQSTDASVITGPRTSSGAIASSPFLRPAGGADVGARI